MMNTPKQLANYLKEYFLSKTGNNTIRGHIFVDTAGAYDLGSAAKPLRTVYATSLSGGGGSGTDELVAANSGATPGYLDTVLAVSSPVTKSLASGVITIGLIKTPLWSDGTQALTGNLSVNTGITIDGVDLSAFKDDYDLHIANPNAHHNKQHSIVDPANHTVTGAQFSVIGLSATNTLGVLSTTSDGSVAFDTILRSSSAGNVKLSSLTTALINASANLTISPTQDIILTPNDRIILSNNIKFEIGGGGFASGFAGYGGRIDYNITRTSKSTIEVDDLYVRGMLNVYELVIQQIRATNGNLFVSDSAKISAATFISGSTYELTVDGDTNDYQPFAVGDILRAQRVNLGSGIQVWQSNLQVSSISPGGDAKKFRATLVSGNTPTQGMDFVRLGSASNSARQGTIYLAASDSNAPFIDILDGITSHATFGTSGTIKVRLGKLSGISDPNFTMSGYGLYSTNAYLKGVVSVANDAVRLDSNGIRIKSAAGNFYDYGAYKFVDSSNNLIGGLYGAEIVQFGASYTNSMSLKTEPSTYGAWLNIYANSGSGANQEARLNIGVFGSPNSKSMSMTFYSPGGASGDAYLTIGDSWSANQYITNLVEFRAQNTIRPYSDLGTNLGTALYRWGTLYVNQIIASTISGTTMNGAEWEYSGSMVVDANSASDTTVTIANQGAGRVDLIVDRNLSIGGDITISGFVDGVDVSALSSSFSSHTSNVNAHHNRDHELANATGLGATHTVSGLTSGHVLKASGASTALFTQLLHSELGGLTTGDPHTQYVSNSVARTITAVHTFNPSVAGAWITLGANATGQLITGLNADLLDGYNSSDFPRKAENATVTGVWTHNPSTATPWIILGANASGQLITGLNSDLLDGYDSSAFPRKAENATISGGWTFSSTINIGTGAKIDFFDEHADKLVFYSNTYGIGTESNYVTIWSPSAFRFRSGGTGVALGTNVFEIQSSGAMLVGTDTDILSTIGRGKIGYMTGVADEFAISHIDFGTASTYMIKQTSTGNVMLNGVTGGYVDIRNNNATKLKVDGTNTVISTNVGIGMTPTVALDVTGAITTTGAATFNFDTNTANYLGKAKIGFVGHTNAAAFGYHTADNTSYAFRQGAGLSTYFNAGTSQWMYFRIGDADQMIMKPAGLVLSASKSFVSNTFNSTTPISGFSLNEIASNKYSFTIGSITADELRVRTFVADETRIDRGDEWWGRGYGIVQTAWTTPAAIGDNGVEVWFENAPSMVGGIFSDGDWIFIRLIDTASGLEIYDIWGQVYSASAGGVGGYLIETTPTYSVNRQRWRFVLRSGEVSYSVPIGVTAVNFGATGQAFINLSTVDGAGAPYIKMGRWSGTDPYSPSNRATEVIIGKLTAISGPTGSVGIYSAYGNSSFELSDAGALLKSLPIQSWNGADQTFNLSQTGTDLWIGVSSADKRLSWNGTTLAITGTITASAGVIGGWSITTGLLSSTGIALDSANSKIYIGASATYGSDGIQLERNGGNPRIYIGDGSNQYFKFDGSVITWAAANASLDSSGNLTVNGGQIGGWTLNSTSLYATNIKLVSGASGTARISAGDDTTSSSAGISSGLGGSATAFWAGSTYAGRASAPFAVYMNGGLVASDAQITGSITATSGSLDNLSITGKLTMSGASSAIAIGTTPPTSSSAGTGLWIDRTGYYGLSAGTYQVKIDATNGKLYAGGGNVILDSNGISLTSVTNGTSDVKWNYSGSKFAWLKGDVDLVGEGLGYLYVNAKARTGTDPGSRIILNAYNAAESDAATLELVNDIGFTLKYASLNGHLDLGNQRTGFFSTNKSALVIQHTTSSSGITIGNVSWGYSSHIGFNAYLSDNTISYEASGAWKYLGGQFTGNVSRPGRLTWDANSGLFRFAYGPAALLETQDITSWQNVLQFGVTSGNIVMGFFGATAVAKAAAYTQTYATATRTHSNLTSSALTDSTGGTADTTLAAVGATYSQTVIRNNFADLAAQVNALRNDIINVKGVLNSAIDDLQSYGLL